jgi:enoyl-CoA hydratase/carnithine racemase
MTDGLHIAIDDAVATLTLDRPEALNALTVGLKVALLDALASIAADGAIRAVILTGAGRAFCAGQDLAERADPVAAPLDEELRDRYNPIIRAMRTLDQPIVAAINGVAAGAGAVIALAADFRLAVPQASVAFLFTKVGLAGADMGAAYLLPRVVGLARATELLMLGDRITADEALRLGLVNRIVEPDALLAEARSLAARLAAGPAFALGMTKTLLNQELDTDFASAIEAEAQGQAICMQTPDFRAAYDAFKARQGGR